MSMQIRYFSLVALLFVSLNSAYAADNRIVLKQSVQDYSSALSSVSMGLEEGGFKLQFVQRVDVGLAKAGYHADKYRIVFFMPTKGVASVLSKRPDLADMFPFKVTVYRDKGKIYIFSVKNSYMLDAKTPKDIRVQFKNWDRQIAEVVNNMF